MNKNNNFFSSLKKLSEVESILQTQNTTAIINFYEDYNLEEYQFILKAYGSYGGKNFAINSTSKIIDITTSCEYFEIKEDILKRKDCKGKYSLSENEKFSIIKFFYDFELYYGESLMIKCKFKKITEKNLNKVETVVFPFLSGTIFCNYKVIIPQGHISLGLKNNYFKNLSGHVYEYYDFCPVDESIEEFRFSPQKTSWEVENEIYVEYPLKFTNDVNFTFPRYFKGGKLKNSYFKIITSENKEYKEEDIILDDLNLSLVVSAKNKERVSFKLYTSFTNDLKRDFYVYFPESYYEINYEKIDPKIKNIAEKIIRNYPDMPNYYSIGKFVHDYLTYDKTYSGKELNIYEIFNGKRGVCVHYTKLYNILLNSIGIKTLFIEGYSFQKETYADENTIGHAWTAALINGKWMELDATWGYFEGVTAGHILTNFPEGTCYSITNEITRTNSPQKIYKIKMIENKNRIEDLNSDKANIIMIVGICFGILIILFCAFYIIRECKRSNNQKLHSIFIEESN